MFIFHLLRRWRWGVCLGILVFSTLLHAQIKIMPIGDSITWGKINKQPPPPGTEGYRKPLHERLTAGGMSVTFVGPHGSVENRGFFRDGARIGFFIHSDSLMGNITDTLSAFHPDIVLLHIGTNNLGFGHPLGDYATPNTIINQMYILVDKITKHADVDHLLLCKIIPKFTTPGAEAEVVAFNSALETMVQQLPLSQRNKVTLIDMWTPFFANKNAYYNLDVDQTHPNSTGYDAMAEIFYYYIARILQPSYIDKFDRPGPALGSEWVYSPGIAITNTGGENGGGSVWCTASGPADWVHLAIWKRSKGLSTVSFKLHSTANPNKTDRVGLLVGLDKDSLTASGYMVWVYNNYVYIKSVVRGDHTKGQVVSSWPLPLLRPGDIFKVTYTPQDDANYFTISVNEGESITLRDRNKLVGNLKEFYGGLIFNQRGSGEPPDNCFVDEFRVDAELPDNIPPGRIYNLAVQFTTNTSVALSWNAPGDDGYTGKASSYDLRYSTRPITSETDFANAIIVPGTPSPNEAGTTEWFNVSGLQSGVGYYFRMRAVDEWGNKGELSDQVYAKTNSAGQVIDDFNRPTEPDGTIGPDWVIDGNEYRIDYNPTTRQGELVNYQTDGRWGSIAVYKGRTNPSIVKLVWGDNATSQGISQGGLALMLTSPQTNASGYLLWVYSRPEYGMNSVVLWEIVRGAIGDSAIDIAPYTLTDAYGNLRPPQRGDTMAVVMDWNHPSGHKFDVYINGLPATSRSLFDGKRRYNATTKYSGIMLGRRNRTNNVTAFITVSEFTGASNIEVVSGNGQSGTVGTTLPDSLKVRIRDANQTPLPGAPVWFTVVQPQDASVGVPPPPVDPIRIEAEWGVCSGTYYVKTGDPGASGGKYIVSPVRGAYAGIAEYTVNIPKDTTYWFWVRLISPDDQHYALVFQVDQTPEWLWSTLPGSRDSTRWQWDRVLNNSGRPASLRLGKGLHKLYLKSAHDNVKVDKILLTWQSSYIPSGMEYVEQLLTNSEGIAGTKLTLGTKAGTNLVVVSTFGTLDTVQFRATGLPSSPVEMTKLNDFQSGPARTPLPKPFIVTLYDQYGNKVPNVVVNFQIIKGDGTLSATKDTTDANGQASTVLTLGVGEVEQQVRATFTGYTGPPVIFTATATSGLAKKIMGLPGQGYGVRHYIGDVLPNFIKAKVVNEQDQPMADVPVTFQVVSGSGTVGKIQPKRTNAQGIVQDTLTLGNIPGIVKVIGRVGTTLQDTVARDSVFYKAHRIAYFSGDRQTASVSDTLAYRLKVKVLDKNGQPVSGQKVEFLTKGHGFHFYPSGLDSIVVTTNISGIAGVNVRLGEIHGAYPNIVEARCSNGFWYIGSVFFTINARSQASALIKIQGDSTEGVVHEFLDQPLVVKMVDAKMNPVVGQPVQFTIKAGGGQLEGTLLPSKVVLTDGDGLAMTYYMLGPTAGEYNNIIEASATNGVVPLYGSPILFRISAKSSQADSILAISSTQLSGTVGKPLPQSIQVKVVDRLGNPVSGEKVKFSVIQGGGVLNESADSTKTVVIDNAGGIASVTWTLGTKAGNNNNILEVSADNGLGPLKGSPLRFVASASPDSVSVIRSTIQATGPVYATEYDTSKIIVTLLDRFGNPVPGKHVHLEVTGGTRNFPQDPTQPTNAEGKAFGFLRSLTSGEKIIQAIVVEDGKRLSQKAKVIFQPTNASKIIPYSGEGQTGNVGTLLKDSLVVRVLDAYDNPVSFNPVKFEVVAGGGQLYSYTSNTDSNGFAYGWLILGPQPGQNVVRVTAIKPNGVHLQGSPLTFSATGVYGEPVAMRYVSGSGQRGPAGEVLPEPFVVQVVDRALNPVAGVEVQFVVSVGVGELATPQPVLTDAFGYAKAFLRTATQSGQTCWVEARNTRLSGSPQRFSAISIPGPARKLVYVSGDRQTGFVGEVLRNPLTVKTTDKYGNAVGGVSVQFSILSGDAKIQDQSSVTVTTDAAGLASAYVTFGQYAGPVQIEASSAYLEGSPIQFTVFASSIAAVNIEKYSGDNQKGRLGQLLVDPLRVIVLDAYGNPVPGTSVYFTKDSGGGSIVEPQPVVSDTHGIAGVHFIAASSPGKSTVSALWGSKTVTFNIESVVNANNPVLQKDLIDSSYIVFEKEDLLIPLVASDADGDPLIFQIGNLFPPAGAVIQPQSSTTAVFRWTPNYDQQGTYKIALRVVDGRGGVDADTTIITVKNLNREPLILSTRPVQKDTHVVTGQTLVFLVNARDPDGDALHYFWKIDGISQGIDLPFLEWNIEKYAPVGTHTVDCFVSDGFISVGIRWNINLRTSVEMAYMLAVFKESEMYVLLEWMTVRETDHQGFEIYRGVTPSGEFKKIHPDLIPPNGGGKYTVVDSTIQAGRTYYYKIVSVDLRGEREENGILSVTVPVPTQYALIQNYPNPFNPVTTIRYHVPKKGPVRIGIYDLLGRCIALLTDRVHEPGYYTVQWDGKDNTGNEAPSGIYLYRLEANGKQHVRKMIKLR